MATLALSIYTPGENHNAESMNTHINILEELLVRWQLMQAETIDAITIIVFTKI